MTSFQAPPLEQRRTKDFERELVERARAWLPSWGLEDEHDFGRALIKVAARLSSEVAERLNRSGDKMRRGFLDWLGVRGKAARPARMPVVVKMPAKAPAPVFAPAPLRMEVPVPGASVVFESETDVRLLPGSLRLAVATDADADSLFLQPPGLTEIEPAPAAPNEWRLKSFASPGSTTLQLDPDSGLEPDAIVEIAGAQYRVIDAKKDLVTIEPAVPAGDGFDAATVVRRVTTFEPFDGKSLDRQEHALYLGDLDLLNLDAEATIDVVTDRAGDLGPSSGTKWQYWGKKDSSGPGWQDLPFASDEKQQADAVVLEKPKGSIDPFAVDETSSRWLRARKRAVDDTTLRTDSLRLRINGDSTPAPCPPAPTTPSVQTEAMSNTTPLVIDALFFPLGKEPRQFDAFYVGSAEAFSKKNAQAQLCFEMAGPTFTSLTEVPAGAFAHPILAGVARDGTLHLLELDPASGSLRMFRDPLQPPLPAFGAQPQSPAVSLDPSPPWRLTVWAEGGDFFVAVTAGSAIWVWHENSASPESSGWVEFGALPTGVAIDGLVYLRGKNGKARLAALSDGKMFVRALPAGSTWGEVPTKHNATVVELSSIVPVFAVSTSPPRTFVAGMVGISKSNKLFRVRTTGKCSPVLASTDFDPETRPVAAKIGTSKLAVVAVDKSHNLVARQGSATKSVPLDSDSTIVGPLAAVVSGGGLLLLAAVRVGSEDRIAAWSPFAALPGDGLTQTPISAGAVRASGAPTVIDGDLVVPGEGGELLVSDFDPSGPVLGPWAALMTDTSTNPELSWEYWNGTGWWKLPLDANQTRNLKKSGAVRFHVPPDLAPSDWAGRTNYWIRARLTGGDYGREKVTVITTPTSPAGSTRQTFDRSLQGIRPPSVLQLRVTYSVSDATAPKYVQTADSGSIRDQSDANRTKGAEVEAFVPLSVSLGRLLGDGSSAAPKEEECPPECDCPGQPGSAAPSSATAAGSNPLLPVTPAKGRSLFLGFDAALSGDTVNVLLMVGRERKGDPAGLAPLQVEALVANRFVPLPAKDGTRAVGESGLITLSFPEEPTPAELFGTSLRWIRLSPHSGDAADWSPSLAGAYLNGVWASATETLTRELLGSSVGEPNMKVKLARPPVLNDSLELRVREFLGEEERQALLAGNPKSVVSDDSNLTGDWVLWEKVDDPADEDPGHRVYSLDEESGEIQFGDGLHGRIPPLGRDSIVAFSYKRTEPPVPGAIDVPGNAVEARTKINLVTPVAGAEAAFSADHAAGGAPAESVERVMRFGSATLRHRQRAVTARDFEDLALESSPDIAQAVVIGRGPTTRLVVVMRGAEPAPLEAQKRELKRHLLDAGPPTLGEDVLEIIEPKLRRLRVRLHLRVESLDDAAAVAEEVKGKLTAFLDTAIGGRSKAGWPLGKSPSDEDIAFAVVGVPRLQGIEKIELGEVRGDGTERPWPTSLAPQELAWLAVDGIRFELDSTEAAA